MSTFDHPCGVDARAEECCMNVPDAVTGVRPGLAVDPRLCYRCVEGEEEGEGEADDECCDELMEKLSELRVMEGWYMEWKESASVTDEFFRENIKRLERECQELSKRGKRV
ncbi:hypothetical protein GUITHDRAFT_121703 [Guillardia theta CCMP2712]|uniref:Uncharacterized protein n=1 Tax=Guillardia theta (strain CCMP2712) TaxID=905079 RepID=L1I8C8_GUITC|nr:hypothetical protein GUITHDRAFT_121703 [Guillardia theta CCMP2712]EKX32110.1 hypothetical protein GUITHDRAFT_121703 [Guillardia theta CCMP2712]|eukprot:XP_005819090.1 hypothetical protein GUITHDRAFT_121703 [Guillardia theta CCMP2712]